MSAFRPPKRLPLTYTEYKLGLTLIPYHVHIIHLGHASPDGTITTAGSGSELFHISNVLQNLRWKEDTPLEAGKGIIGIGASKVTIFVSILVYYSLVASVLDKI